MYKETKEWLFTESKLFYKETVAESDITSGNLVTKQPWTFSFVMKKRKEVNKNRLFWNAIFFFLTNYYLYKSDNFFKRLFEIIVLFIWTVISYSTSVIVQQYDFTIKSFNLMSNKTFSTDSFMLLRLKSTQAILEVGWQAIFLLVVVTILIPPLRTTSSSLEIKVVQTEAKLL